jgi:NAD(P)-dependent dehydrogenase (short-subunit alcohol dehydrogenase family)
MHIDLTGKVALVTGSAHRVGRAIALALAGEGCHLLIHYNGSVDKSTDTVNAAQALGVRAERFRADLSQPDQVARLFNAIESTFGKLDILVNSASIFERGDLLGLTLEEWQRSLDVNLTAPFLCTQYAARLMPEKGGVIINISDMGGLKGAVGYPQHSVSKAGLLMLTQISARALAPRIRVNAIVPGLVLQPPDYSDANWTQLAQKMPLKRPGSAEDVGRAVVYLASEDFITGEVLTVDGGEHLL